ncbi:MAG TPA: methionyl-tRNA formyltransferase [Candidatus Omnitrophica bacterium]|nr:methionyl-tRNA formyltransferase [Candidatus Omnitrophota bacterium]
MPLASLFLIMNIIFFGSDDFAAVHLEALFGSEHKVCACVTQPDKARGRGMEVSASPVKETALRKGVPVFQPSDLKEQNFLKGLRVLEPDLFVVIAYGRLLPAEVLAIPRTFAVNVHSSLLPQYRGAAPINWAVINGERETGISIMRVTAKMDAGDIVTQKRLKILKADTAASVRARMMETGPELLLKTIDSLEKGTYTFTVQDDQKATPAPKLTKELGHIQWGKPARAVNNLARGLLPWPTAYTYYQGKLLKILETEVVPGNFLAYSPGEVATVDKKGFTVATADQGLLVKAVHLEASRPMSAYQFMMGHRLGVGFRFDK